MTFSLDHLVVCVRELDDNPYPFESVEGGRHEGHGTANRIVPLGDAYIELVSVVDDAEASDSPFGRWVSSHMDSVAVDALCLRTTDITSLEPTPMHRIRPDGVRLSWQLAGLGTALAQHVPFFIQWDDMAMHPGLSSLNGGARVESVIFSGDRQRLLALTGPVDRLTYVDGPTGIDFTIAGS